MLIAELGALRLLVKLSRQTANCKNIVAYLIVVGAGGGAVWRRRVCRVGRKLSHDDQRHAFRAVGSSPFSQLVGCAALASAAVDRYRRVDF